MLGQFVGPQATAVKCSSKARQQLTSLNRVSQVIIRARLQSRSLVAIRASRRKRDDGGIRMRAHSAQRLDPSYAWSPTLEQDRVVLFLFQLLDSLLNAASFADLAAVRGQSVCRGLKGPCIFADYQYRLFAHKTFSFVARGVLHFY